MALHVALVVGAACSACSTSSGDPDETEQSSAAVASSKAAFYRVAPGSNGGYELTSLDRDSKTHVAGVDYSGSGLDARTTAALASLPQSELVLEGTVSGSTLRVSTVYEGMPGITYPSSATFYEASGSTAHALNESVSRSFTSVDVSAAAAPYVQASWLANEVSKGALVAGEVTQGTKILKASQVFIALPYTGGPCVISSHVCPDATPVQTFTRDDDECLEFAGCAAIGICPDFVPECWTGYTMTSWRGGPGACLQYACDPSFLRGG